MGVRATLVEQSSSRTVLDAPPVKNPIRLGVVGLGPRGVGNVCRKSLNYDDYRLTAVCDIREKLVEHATAVLEREHGTTVRGYTDYSEMLAKEELDAVAVQVDVDRQPALICEGLEAGCHVMSEVPLAFSMDDCWRVVTTVERTGKVFLLMEQTRFWGFIRAWHEIVQSGVIGRPIFVEGEYIGYYGTDFYFQDDEGRLYTAEQSRGNPRAKPTWRHRCNMVNYMPHELSPLLYVLEDRVNRVTAMATRRQSYRHPEVKQSDVNVALMHTDKDAVMKVATGFTTPVIHRGATHHHWYHIKGTEGVLEWSRAQWDQPKLWVEKWQMPHPAAMPWSTSRTDSPAAAKGSGHGDADFFVFAQFADAVLRGVPAELDVYKAVETAAPAILAGQSIDENNVPIDVPDFRPGPNRKAGDWPKGMQ